MKLYVRTLNNQGREFLPVELPDHFLELAFVPDGAEPGGQYDICVEPQEPAYLGILTRDAQLHCIPKSCNSVKIKARPFAE